MEVDGRLYDSFRLNVMKQLCGDVVLGTDFQALYKRVIFEINGDLPAELTVSNAKSYTFLPITSQFLLKAGVI